MENAVGICPYDPADNTTAVLVGKTLFSPSALSLGLN